MESEEKSAEILLKERIVRFALNHLCKECTKNQRAPGSSRCTDCSLLFKNKQNVFNKTVIKHAKA
jgi:hypothetical protein